jgi:predicted lysophospholipase L1 biosynthesis ABC-type transport system permease subunit
VARRDFERAVASFCAGIQQSTCLVTDQRPNGVTNYVSIDRTPQILAGLLAVLGLAVLAQFAAVSARQSRHDFAVLAALGLRRRQLRAIRCWQLTALSGLVLLIGLPLGIAAGRYGWGRFAAGAGVPASPVIPVTLLLLTVAAVLAAATVIALRFGGRGAYGRPDQALRAE